MFGLVVSVGVLWFLISYFTRGTDGGYQKTVGIIMIVLASNLIMSFTLQPIIGGFSILITMAVLFFAVEWICDIRRKQALIITGCYFLVMLMIHIMNAVLMIPVDAN